MLSSFRKHIFTHHKEGNDQFIHTVLAESQICVSEIKAIDAKSVSSLYQKSKIHLTPRLASTFLLHTAFNSDLHDFGLANFYSYLPELTEFDFLPYGNFFPKFNRKRREWLIIINYRKSFKSSNSFEIK